MIFPVDERMVEVVAEGVVAVDGGPVHGCCRSDAQVPQEAGCLAWGGSTGQEVSDSDDLCEISGNVKVPMQVGVCQGELVGRCFESVPSADVQGEECFIAVPSGSSIGMLDCAWDACISDQRLQCTFVRRWSGCGVGLGEGGISHDFSSNMLGSGE